MQFKYYMVTAEVNVLVRAVLLFIRGYPTIQPLYCEMGQFLFERCRYPSDKRRLQAVSGYQYWRRHQLTGCTLQQRLDGSKLTSRRYRDWVCIFLWVTVVL